MELVPPPPAPPSVFAADEKPPPSLALCREAKPKRFYSDVYLAASSPAGLLLEEAEAKLGRSWGLTEAIAPVLPLGVDPESAIYQTWPIIITFLNLK